MAVFFECVIGGLIQLKRMFFQDFGDTFMKEFKIKKFDDVVFEIGFLSDIRKNRQY